MRAQPNPVQVVAVVAKGEVELGIFLINVLTAPGLEVVGPFPAELQQNVVFTAAVGSEPKKPPPPRPSLNTIKVRRQLQSSNRRA